MKYFLKLIIAVFILIFFLVLIFYIVFSRVGKKAESIVGTFRPDVSKLADGKYHGSYTTLGGQISSDVSFEIKNGKLWLINFDKLYGTPVIGAPQKIKDRIDSLQNLDFDAVTGATVTSNLAKAAIKNAIDNGAGN